MSPGGRTFVRVAAALGVLAVVVAIVMAASGLFGRPAGGSSAGSSGAGGSSAAASATASPVPSATRATAAAQPSALSQLSIATPPLIPAPLTASAPAVTAGQPSVVVIGDSIMDGHGVDLDQSWPALISQQNGWQLTNLSSDGTGFLTPGNDDTVFQDQANVAESLQPAVVIISASSNDLGHDGDALGQATDATFQSLREALPNTQIIALSAFWGDGTPPDELTDIDNQVQDAATAVGAVYVDIGQPLAGQPDLMQDDDVHPTAQGLQVLAAAISADLSAQLGLG